MENNGICIIEGCNERIRSKSLCTKHYFRIRRYGSSQKHKGKRLTLLEEGKSYCPLCDKIKALLEFNKDKQTNTGYAIYCRECNKKKALKRYHSNKRKHKSTILKSKFGITLQEYEDILKKQNGKCAICRSSIRDNNKALAVDHDHETNEIRGLLCSKCNSGLGFFGDRIELLEQAISYLKKRFPKPQ